MRSNSAMTVYFGHADGALTDRSYLGGGYVENPYTRAEFYKILNAHLLLYDKLVIPDNHLIHNTLLREGMVDRYGNPGPYRRFLQDGTIAVAFREEVGKSFVTLEEHLREYSAYGHPPPSMILDYAEFLDANLPKGSPTYDSPRRLEITAALVETALTDEQLLRDTRLVTVARTIRDGMRRAGASAGSGSDPSFLPLGGRSWYYRLADDVGQRDPAQASRIRQFASAASTVGMSHVLGLDPSYPIPVSRLVGPLESVFLPRSVRPPTVGSDGLAAEFDDGLQRSLLVGEGALLDVRPDVIADIRSGAAFKTFRSAFAEARSDTDPARSRVRISRALSTYLAALEETLGLEVVGLRDRHTRLKRWSKWLGATGFVGSAALGGVGLVFPLTGESNIALTTIGLAWSVVGAAAPALVTRNARSVREEARARLLRASQHQPELIQFSGGRK